MTKYSKISRMKTVIKNQASPEYLNKLLGFLSFNFGLEVGMIVYHKSDFNRKKNPLIFLGIDLDTDRGNTVVNFINDDECYLVYLRFLEIRSGLEIRRVPELNFKDIFRYATNSEAKQMQLYLHKNSQYKEDPYRISDWTAFPHQVGSGILVFDKIALLGYFSKEYKIFREKKDV